MAATAEAQPPTPPVIIEVRGGDTFSGIATRFTGEVLQWRELYDLQRSGIPNPDLIRAGDRLELVSGTDGKRYLRLLPAAGVADPARAAEPSPAVEAAAPAVAANTRPVAAPAAAAPHAALPPIPMAERPDGALVIGVLPNIGAAALLSHYEHLKRYLERLNGQKVRIEVPSSFKTFFYSTITGQYDLAVSAPHLARVAQLDRSLIPLAVYEPRIHAVLVAPIDSKLKHPRELRNQTVAFSNPQSLVAMYGRQWLQQQGLQPEKDYQVKAARTDLGVGRMLLVGDAMAAIMSNGEFRALPPDEVVRLKIVEVFARIPNFVVLAHPGLERDRTSRLKAQLKSFLADKQDGAAFVKATGFSAIVDSDEALLRELDPYLDLTRQAMDFVR